MVSADEKQRFWAKVDKDGPIPEYRPQLGPCWLWTAAVNLDGYGRFETSTGPQRIHRLAHEWLIGPIPEGLTVDHLCRVRHCVRPDHLEAVTNRVNVLRGFGITAAAARKTHCPQGHPYAGANLYVSPKGRRYCRLCARARHLARRGLVLAS